MSQSVKNGRPIAISEETATDMVTDCMRMLPQFGHAAPVSDDKETLHTRPPGNNGDQSGYR